MAVEQPPLASSVASTDRPRTPDTQLSKQFATLLGDSSMSYEYDCDLQLWLVLDADGIEQGRFETRQQAIDYIDLADINSEASMTV